MALITRITIKKLTDIELLRDACESTFNGKSLQTLFSQYRSEESPARTQLFWITLDPIYLFVSTHLIRHHVGSQPFALTHREDRQGGEDKGRYTPTRLSLLINAQGLIDMAKLRLCKSASKETQDVMKSLKKAIEEIDPDLAKFMVSKCIYRNGLCHKRKCAFYKTPEGKKQLKIYQEMFEF